MRKDYIIKFLIKRRRKEKLQAAIYVTETI